MLNFFGAIASFISLYVCLQLGVGEREQFLFSDSAKWIWFVAGAFWVVVAIMLLKRAAELN